MVCEEKVGEAAAGDGKRVGEEDGRTGAIDEESHEDEVAEERDEAVGKMEAEELSEWFAGRAF